MFRLAARPVAASLHIYAWLPYLVIAVTMLFLVLQARQTADLVQRLAVHEAQMTARERIYQDAITLLELRVDALEQEVATKRLERWRVEQERQR